MERTPQEHIDAIKALCADLEQEKLIEAIDINDWGRYSNFDLHIVPSEHTRHTTRQLKALIKRHLKGTGAHLREVFPPIAQYEWDSIERKQKKTGYDRIFWAVDVDFREYDIESNSFD